MQSVYCTSAAWDGPAGADWPPRNAFSAASSYWLHGPLFPCTSADTAADTSRMAMLITPWASMVGSVWLGSPCVRMQAAHSSMSRVALPPVSAVVVLPLSLRPLVPLPPLVPAVVVVVP